LLEETSILLARYKLYVTPVLLLSSSQHQHHHHHHHHHHHVFVFVLFLCTSFFICYTECNHISQWPCGLRRRCMAARPLRLWVRIPPRVRMFVCCECCVLSGRGLCDGLITRPEESYRLWLVIVWSGNLENEEAKARYGTVENTTKIVVTPRKQTTVTISLSLWSVNWK